MVATQQLNPSRRVLVVGAGGLGSYVGAVLARAGHDVTMLIRGAHGDAVRQSGLRIDANEGSYTVHPRCVDPSDPPGPADVVLVAVKAYSLDEVAPALVELSQAGAAVVSLLNGVDASQRLVAAGVPAERMLDAVAYVTAFRAEPGRIERKGDHQRLLLGSSSGAGSDVLADVAGLFAATAVEVTVTEDIRVELWRKMAVVCSLAVLCGMTGSALGPIRQHPFGASLQEQAIGEVLSVGRASGVSLPPDAESAVGAVLDAFPDDFYPSVLHDLRSGRPTEMDQLGGVVSRIGRQVGVGTPLADAATCAVALLEARAP